MEDELFVPPFILKVSPELESYQLGMDEYLLCTYTGKSLKVPCPEIVISIITGLCFIRVALALGPFGSDSGLWCFDCLQFPLVPWPLPLKCGLCDVTSEKTGLCLLGNLCPDGETEKSFRRC